MIIPDGIEPELLAAVVALMDDPPQGSMALESVLVMYRFVDDDGDGNIFWHTRGSERTTSTELAGMIEVVKAELLAPHVARGLRMMDDE